MSLLNTTFRRALLAVILGCSLVTAAAQAAPHGQNKKQGPSNFGTLLRQGQKTLVANPQTSGGASKFVRRNGNAFPNGNTGISGLGLGLPQTPPPSKVNTTPPQPHVRLDRAALRASLPKQAGKPNGNVQGLIANRNGQVNPTRQTFSVGDIFSNIGPGKSAPPIDPPTGKTTSGPLKVDPAPAPAPAPAPKSDKPRYKEVGKLGVHNTTPATTTTPTTPPPVTTTPPPTTGGDMGNGDHHHHGDWIPGVVGAIVQARMNSGYNNYPVYSQPVYPAPVYVQPQYVAPVQYAAPAPVYAPAAGSLVIYAVEPLNGAPGQYLIRGDGFGTQVGQILLDVNGVRMGMETVSWIPNAVVVKFPNVQVAPGVTPSFTVVRADGLGTQPFNPAAAGAVAAR